MADTETQNPESTHSVDEIRQQLLRRIAIAGAVIISLIAGLALFDASYVSEPVVPPVAVAPVAPPPAVDTVAKPEVTPEPPPPPPAAIEPPPVEPAKPIAEAPAAPEVTKSPEAPPLRTPKPLTKPAVAQPASIKPAPPAIAPAPVKPAEALAKASKTPPAPAKPLTQQAAQSDAGRRYLVQMGVFNTVSNAEELLGKLHKAGIPAQIEARVQVGPFASKAEAEAAQKKLTELGLDGGMLVSSRK